MSTLTRTRTMTIDWEDPPEPGDLLVSEPGGSWYLVDSIRPVKHRVIRPVQAHRMTVVPLGRGYRALPENHPGASIRTFHWHSRDGGRPECPYCDGPE